jgi:hypothetical protein
VPSFSDQLFLALPSVKLLLLTVVSVFVYTITRIFARAYLVECSSPFQETIAEVAIDSRFRRNRSHFPSHANISH